MNSEDDIQNLKNKLAVKDLEVKFLLQKVKSLYVKLDKKQKDINYTKEQLSYFQKLFEISSFLEV